MSPQKLLVVVTIIFTSSFLAAAHEFWMEPDKFYFKPGESARIHFRIGEDFIGEQWNIREDRIVHVTHHMSGGVEELKHLLIEDTTGYIQIPLASEGTHVIAVETNTAFIRLEGKKFTEYLEEDGLDEVLYQRRKAGTSGDSASELYSRHTKLILQTGAASDDSFKKICNLPIEIVPEEDPSALKKGDRIGFKILFQGKPLFGAKVKVWNRYNRRTSVQNIFSQQDGRIETHVSNPGVWMVSVVRMVPYTEPGAQYRSYWGTLVFGVR